MSSLFQMGEAVIIIIAGVSMCDFLIPEPGARCHSMAVVSHPDRRLVGLLSLDRRESESWRWSAGVPGITEYPFGRNGGRCITYEGKKEEIRAAWGALVFRVWSRDDLLYSIPTTLGLIRRRSISSLNLLDVKPSQRTEIHDATSSVLQST